MRTPRFALVLLVATGTAAVAGDYNYSPIGKRDPFRAPEHPREPKPCRHATCRFRVDDFRLQALVTGEANKVAMVVAPDGTGYSVHVGMSLGQEGARVTAIDTKGVHLELRDDGRPPSELLIAMQGEGDLAAPEDLSNP